MLTCASVGAESQALRHLRTRAACRWNGMPASSNDMDTRGCYEKYCVPIAHTVPPAGGWRVLLECALDGLYWCIC